MNSLSLGSIVGKKAKQNKTKQLDWGGKKAGVTSVRDRNERDHSLSPRFFHFVFLQFTSSSSVSSIIDHRNDVKMFKILQWNLSSPARGSTWIFEHFDGISMVDKSRDHRKLLSICW